jgi:outer membrane autotransporter protein
MCSWHARLASSAAALVLALGLPAREAAATTCTDGAAATIDTGNCTVQTGTVPTTVTFSAGATGQLILNGAAPSGLVSNATAGQGAVVVQGSVTMTADFGSGLSHYLQSLSINDGATLNAGHNIKATTVTVGQGSGGVLNQTGQAIAADYLVLRAGATLNQTGGTLEVGNTTIGSGATLTLRNQGTGFIDGAANGQGTLIFAHDYTTDEALGSTASLNTITVNSGSILTLQKNANATNINVNGTLNQSAGTLTATTLALGSSATYTQTGSGVINASNTTLGSGANLTLKNQGTGAIDGAAAGQGTLTFSGNYNTDAAIGGTHRLAALNVNDGVTLTLDQHASATNVTVGQGTSGVLNQSAGTLAATTLAIAAGGTLTQTGTGVINTTNTTLGSGASLTLKNQGTGAIDGAAAGQGTLTFSGNYDTDAAIGGANRLATLNVNSGVTLTLDQSARANSFTVNGTVAQSAGTLTATTLAINNGGVFNQSGTASIAAASTIYDGGTFNVGSAFTHTGALTLGSGSSGTLRLNANTLTVTGNFTMAAGSTLRTTINADSANAAGRIVASGPVSIAANTTIDLTVVPATLTAGQTYVIVSGAAGGSISLPASIISSNADYEFVASSDGSSLTLTTRSAASYVQAARSANTRAIAHALQAARTTGSSDMKTVLSQLNGLSSSGAKDAAMASMAPPLDNGLTFANRLAQELVFSTIGSRLESVRNPTAGGPSGVSTGNPADGVGIWLQAFANEGTQDARDGAPGFKTRTSGFALSTDTVLPDDRWTLGASFAYAGSSISFRDQRSGNGNEIASYQLSLYGSYTGDGFHVDAITNVSANTYTSRRQITVGSINRIANGSFNGLQYSAKATVGLPVQRGDLLVTPLASLEYTHMRIHGYTETGADALNLNVAAQRSDFLQAGLGASVRFSNWLGRGKLSSTLRAMFLYDTIADPQTVASSFTGGGGTSFTTRAPDAARQSVKVGVGMSYALGRYRTWSLNYDALLKDGFVGHTGMLTYHQLF